MAIRTVANASQLNAAIKSAGNGDTIKLKAGNYGSVKIANSNKVLTIESEQTSNPARFGEVLVIKSSNITFDNLDFDGVMRGGFGTGTGLRITQSSNIKVEDSDFQDFYKGISVASSQGISVIRNEFTRHSEDAMVFGNVNGLQVLFNEVKGMKAPKEAHHDMIQIHPVNGSSSNVVIRGNVLDSNDLITQGIFLGNGGGVGGTHRNITIDDNKIIGGHLHGITVLKKTAGLTITDNIVLKDSNNGSFKGIDTPTINIAKGSSNVQVKGNTAYEINGASEAGNTIVSESVKFGGSLTPPSGGGSSSNPAPSTPSTPSFDSDDIFRFDGDDVRGWTKKVVRDVDLDQDELRFTDYDRGTFDDFGGGNPLSTSWDGRSATVDSRADLQELIAASKAVSPVDWGDTLTLRIKQSDGTHALVLQNIGDADEFIGGLAPSGGGSNSGPSPSKPSPGSDDVFRFDGSDVRGWTKELARNVDLARDKLEFNDYDLGTFKNFGGGNPLSTSWDGRSASIDSRDDIKELIAASPDIKAQKWYDTLALVIRQDDGVHQVILQNVGDPNYFF